jgi:hypothetical protein
MEPPSMRYTSTVKEMCVTCCAVHQNNSLGSPSTSREFANYHREHGSHGDLNVLVMPNYVATESISSQQLLLTTAPTKCDEPESITAL